MNNIFKQLEALFAVSDFETKKEKLAFLTVEKRHLVPALKFAKDNMGFGHLILITVVDWLENGVFQITYLLKNPEKQLELGFRVFIPRKEPVMESVHTLWETAATYQREIKEMFGVDFPGSPRVNDSFILEGWHDIPPYRRDFDTKKYSEETYFPRPGRTTNDPEEHMKKKLYPESEV